MSAFTDVLRRYADRANDNLNYRAMVPEHVLRDAAAVIEEQRELRTAVIRYLATDGSTGMYDAMELTKAREALFRFVTKDEVLAEEDRIVGLLKA